MLGQGRVPGALCSRRGWAGEEAFALSWRRPNCASGHASGGRFRLRAYEPFKFRRRREVRAQESRRNEAQGLGRSSLHRTTWDAFRDLERECHVRPRGAVSVFHHPRRRQPQRERLAALGRRSRGRADTHSSYLRRPRTSATIRSRCQTGRFAPIPREIWRVYLPRSERAGEGAARATSRGAARPAPPEPDASARAAMFAHAPSRSGRLTNEAPAPRREEIGDAKGKAIRPGSNAWKRSSRLCCSRSHVLGAVLIGLARTPRPARRAAALPARRPLSRSASANQLAVHVNRRVASSIFLSMIETEKVLHTGGGPTVKGAPQARPRYLLDLSRPPSSRAPPCFYLIVTTCTSSGFAEAPSERAFRLFDGG